MKSLILVGLVFAFSLPLLSGQEAGNGAVGVKAGNKVYLLDFAENGIEESAYVKNLEVYDEDIYDVVFSKMNMPEFPQPEITSKIVAAKLTELRDFAPSNSLLLTRIIAELNWRITNFTLTETNEENSNIELAEDRVQLAVRKRNVVRLNKIHLASLDDFNRAGLILHEARYAAEPFTVDINRISEEVKANCAASSRASFTKCIERAGSSHNIQAVQRTRDYIGSIFIRGYQNWLDTDISDTTRSYAYRKTTYTPLDVFIQNMDLRKRHFEKQPSFVYNENASAFLYISQLKGFFVNEYQSLTILPISEEELVEEFCDASKDTSIAKTHAVRHVHSALRVIQYGDQFSYNWITSSNTETLYFKQNCGAELIKYLKEEISSPTR